MNSKVAVIVGAGPGMGLAVGKRFAKEGFAIALIARTEASLQKLTAELKSQGAVAEGFVADVAVDSSLAQALDSVKARLGPIEVLVYNAAAVHRDTPLELGVETLIADLRVNVGGALLSTQKVVPDMKARQRGTILLTGGFLAQTPMPILTSLSVGKAALRNLALTLSQALEPSGIHAATVTIGGMIEPGGRFDPDKIADVFWSLHAEPKGAFRAEAVVA